VIITACKSFNMEGNLESAKSVVHKGDFILGNQQQYKDLQSIDELQGSLTIGDPSAIIDLAFPKQINSGLVFPKLKKVTGVISLEVMLGDSGLSFPDLKEAGSLQMGSPSYPHLKQAKNVLFPMLRILSGPDFSGGIYIGGKIGFTKLDLPKLTTISGKNTFGSEIELATPNVQELNIPNIGPTATIMHTYGNKTKVFCNSCKEITR
ncbi:MAG: hypothetical protein NTV34_08350, partial [Proteobacteria bacterium]|nr:hypothetical protein [Pseudomonadota bacterium]